MVDQLPFAGRSGCIQSLAVTRDAATHHLPHTPIVTYTSIGSLRFPKANRCDEAVGTQAWDCTDLGSNPSFASLSMVAPAS